MSELTKCPSGMHFYDAGRYRECPYCQKKSGRSAMLPNAPEFDYETWQSAPADKGVTVGKESGQEVLLDLERVRKPSDRGLSAEQDGLTQGYLASPEGDGFIAGWLVGIKGPARGKDFRIYPEKNYVGRSHNSNVIIPGDTAIQWEKHCSIIYDGKHEKRFYVIPAKGMIRLNGKPQREGAELKSGDRLSIGNSVFEFVPFCREGHTWGEGELKTDE